MTVSNQRIIEYQELYKQSFGTDISFEKAKTDALHLLKILRVLRRK